MFRRLLPLMVVCLLTAGCGSAEDAAPTDAAQQSATISDSKPAAAKGELAAAKSASTKLAKFEPPFPQRTELFDPPRSGQSTVRRDDEHGDSIELKGFVNVNGPQVVLEIDGVLMPIPEGGERYGVQVISIKPPQVVLQRGRNRWTASLE